MTKTTTHYNECIVITNISLQTYGYVDNGKPAFEWLMERQAITIDKDSVIVNDANLWTTETMAHNLSPRTLPPRHHSQPLNYTVTFHDSFR